MSEKNKKADAPYRGPSGNHPILVEVRRRLQELSEKADALKADSNSPPETKKEEAEEEVKT